ncbi:YfdX family protein [Hydrogenimonas sp.]
MKKRLLLSVVTAGAILATTAALAEPGNFGVNGKEAWTEPMQKRIEHTDSFGDTYYTYSVATPAKTVHKEIRHHAERFQKPPKEILDGLKATMEALSSLQKGERTKAEKALKKAVALFDRALKADPKLSLVPIDQAIEVKVYEGNIDSIKSDILLAANLLKAYRTQEARDLLLPLEDEIDITTHYLPMELYPKAAKEALKLLERGKREEAKATLLLGLDTIVADEVVIPVPLLAARELVDAASKVEKRDAKKALEMVKTAKKELYKALLLGYTAYDAKAYRTLNARIDTIQKELAKGRGAHSLFERIKKDFESLLQKTRERKRTLKESGSVWKGTAKAHAKAAREETNDKLRFEEKMKADDF